MVVANEIPGDRIFESVRYDSASVDDLRARSAGEDDSIASELVYDTIGEVLCASAD